MRIGKSPIPESSTPAPTPPPPTGAILRHPSTPRRPIARDAPSGDETASSPSPSSLSSIDWCASSVERVGNARRFVRIPPIRRRLAPVESSDGWCAARRGASVVSVVGRDVGEHGYVCRESERSSAAAGAAVADALDVGGLDHGGAPGRKRDQVPVSGGVFGRLHGEVALVV